MAAKRTRTKAEAPPVKLWSDGYACGSHLNETAGLIVTATGNVLGDLYKELTSRLAEVESKLALLEGKQMKFCGVWHPGQYAEGSMVSHSGSAWVARAETNEKPGNSATAWQLAVKRGGRGC